MTAIIYLLSLLCIAGNRTPNVEPAKPAAEPDKAALKVDDQPNVHDAPLSPQDQKRYDSNLAAVRKRSQPARGKPDPAQTALQLFAEAAVHLQFGQQAQALDADHQALDALLEKWQTNTRRLRADLGVLQPHFDSLAKLLEKDSKLLMTLLNELDDQYVQIFARSKQLRTPRPVFVPLGLLWVRLAHIEKLDESGTDRASFWTSFVGLQAFVDRPVSNAERGPYAFDLTSSNAAFNTPPTAAHLQTLGLTSKQIRAGQEEIRSLAHGGPHSATPTRVSSDAVALWNSLGLADIRFTQAMVHLKYGQERQSALAFADGIQRVNGAPAQFAKQIEVMQQRGLAVAAELGRASPALADSFKSLAVFTPAR